MLPIHSFWPILLCTGLLLTAAACGSSNEIQKDQDDDLPGPRLSTVESEEGYIVESLDTEGDGHPDIVRYFEEYQDPRDDTRIRRRIRKMEIDVNGDQQFNVRRYYDEFGNLQREENDLNLDGAMNSTLYYVGGELARKEFLDNNGEHIRERRIYYEGELVRVERDRHGDGEVDRWEYYEDGVLMRIGLDTVGDGSADTWQMR